MRRRPRTLVRLLRYARPYVPHVLVVVLCSGLYAGGLAGRAWLTKPLVDEIALPGLEVGDVEELLRRGVPPGERGELERERALLRAQIERRLLDLLAAAALLVLGMPAVRWVRDFVGEYVMTKMLVDMQNDACAKLLRLPLARHEAEPRGELVARTMSDTAAANRAQAIVFGDALQDAATVVVGTAAAFWIHWRLALVTLAVGPPVAAILQVFGRRIRRSSRARQEQIAEVVQRLLQILSGIKIIKAFGQEQSELEAFRAQNRRYLRRALRVVRNRVLSRSLVELASQGAFVTLLLVGVYAILAGLWGISLGVLMAFLLISGTLYRPTKNLTRVYNQVVDALPAAERFFELLDAPEEPLEEPGTIELREFRESIEYDHVVFSYGREPVLRGVDLVIRKGETVALVGPTGAGKTTLADLLLRFYDPDEGAVRIDGIDLRRVSRRSLRRLIGVVTQEPFLFDATIYDNIRYGRPEATPDEVIAAARAAYVEEFVERLPEGYGTWVGEQGARLSGGQRQRIAIARAILRDPQILVLDEATSALDARSEQLVQRALANLSKGRTVLVIAHRLATIRSAHRIALLEDGRIRAVGTHEELLRADPHYRELVELQTRGAAAEA